MTGRWRSGGEPRVRLGIGSVETALGTIWIAATDAGVRVVTVPGGSREACLAIALRQEPGAEVVEGGVLVEALKAELAAYVAGERTEFAVPLDLRGTPFQQRVWQAVAAIPYGETATYREIAARIGAPRAVRAVGAANGANPAAIVIPCHRVLGSDGSLTGYGGGLAMKRALLDLERRTTYPREVPAEPVGAVERRSIVRPS